MAAISRLRLRVPDDVIFVGHVYQLELADYYCSEALLVYPSLYEGFGFPPLEAMACGCPVVASNTSSLPEVVGDAGILVYPYDSFSLAEGIRRVRVLGKGNKIGIAPFSPKTAKALWAWLIERKPRAKTDRVASRSSLVVLPNLRRL